MHSYQQSRPGSSLRQPFAQQNHTVYDSDDDHVPLSAMAGIHTDPAARQQYTSHNNTACFLQQQQQNDAALYDQYLYSQQQPQQAMQTDYQYQLEMEHRQQQQQFLQQNFYQDQYGMQPAYQYSDAIPADYRYSLGFQNTPYNPNIPQQYAQQQQQAYADAMTVHTGVSANQQHPVTARREVGRPWVRKAGTADAESIAPVAAPQNAPAQDSHAKKAESKSSGSGSGSDSDSETDSDGSGSSSSALSSSTNSAYEGSSDEEIPMATVDMSTPASRQPSTSTSASRAGNSHSRSTSFSPADASSSKSTSTHVRRKSSIKPSCMPTVHSDASSDDDVPLSNISAESIHRSKSMAALRRSKSAAVAVAGGGSSGSIPDTPIKRNTPGSRSMLVRPSMHSPSSSEVPPLPKLPDMFKSSSGKFTGGGLAAQESSDEDAPLDKLQEELVSGARSVPNLPDKEAGAKKLKRRSGKRKSKRDKRRSSGSKGESAKSGRNASAGKYYDNYDDESAKSEAEAESDSKPAKEPVQAPVQKPAPEAPLPELPPNPINAIDLTTSPLTLEKKPADSSDDDVYRRPQPPPESDSDSPGRNDKKKKNRKSGGYLPKGMTLPAIPLRARTVRARGPVTYMALDDIVDTYERAAELKMQAEEQQIEKDVIDNMNLRDLAACDIRPVRHKSRHKLALQTNAAGEVHEMFEEAAMEEQDVAESVSSFRGTDGSSNDTILSLLRTERVELQAASTEHSGSKAIVQRVVPEDYSDLDSLLADLEGIMGGKIGARKRFSLALMRHSLAVERGLIEPVDYSEKPEEELGEEESAPIPDFQPIEIPNIGEEDEKPLEEGLGLDEIITKVKESEVTDDAKEENAGGAEDDKEDENAEPVELTREQKIQKALERLDMLDFRKVSIRIYVYDARRYYTFVLTEYSTCEMILNDMKRSGIIDARKNNWALFELVDYFGIERPLNHFENIMSVVDGWEPRSNNYIIVKGFGQQSSLTLTGGVQPGDHAIQGMMYYRIKKSKWQKSMFRLTGHNLVYTKDGRGRSKKEEHYLSLTNNDVYTPFQPLRGSPTRYVFGLKSEMPMQMFEKPDEDYVKWFAVQTLDGLREWLQVLRLAKNQIKFRTVLERRVAETNAIRDHDKNNVSFKPLMDLVHIDHHADAEKGGNFTTDVLSSINKIASATKYDPSALVQAVEASGVDVSEFKALGSKGGVHNQDDNDEAQVPDITFEPGSLLSKPRKMNPDGNSAGKSDSDNMFIKGSLLAQPRESKAMAASRAMQSVMAQDGDVFTHGSLLRITEQTKPRPAHFGGAPNMANSSMFPLVQMEPQAEPAFGDRFRATSTQLHHAALEAQAGYQPAVYDPYANPDEVAFGGLLANAQQRQQAARQQQVEQQKLLFQQSLPMEQLEAYEQANAMHQPQYQQQFAPGHYDYNHEYDGEHNAQYQHQHYRHY